MHCHEVQSHNILDHNVKGIQEQHTRAHTHTLCVNIKSAVVHTKQS